MQFAHRGCVRVRIERRRRRYSLNEAKRRGLTSFVARET